MRINAGLILNFGLVVNLCSIRMAGIFFFVLDFRTWVHPKLHLYRERPGMMLLQPSRATGNRAPDLQILPLIRNELGVHLKKKRRHGHLIRPPLFPRLWSWNLHLSSLSLNLRCPELPREFPLRFTSKVCLVIPPFFILSTLYRGSMGDAIASLGGGD